MTTETSSFLSRANEGDSTTYLASGSFMTWKATAETTEGRFDQFESVDLPHSGSPEHIHAQQDELYYILAGTYRIKVGDAVFIASPGDFVRIPAGTTHAWQCLGTNAGKMLVTFVPGGMRGFFEEVRPLFLAPKMDYPAAMEIGAKYGLVITGPPLAEDE